MLRKLVSRAKGTLEPCVVRLVESAAAKAVTSAIWKKISLAEVAFVGMDSPQSKGLGPSTLVRA